MHGFIKYEGDSIYLEEVGPQHTKIRYELKEILHTKRSAFQLVEVVESYDYGRMLVLDGNVNVCEKDEAVYHEMIAHIPALLHPHPEVALVVGGGDGGTVRELLRHPQIERIDVVEIDAEVIEASQKYFPSLAESFQNPRVRLFCDDGKAFVGNVQAHTYDIIIIDSSDPVGPAEGLFTREFYETCSRILSDTGIVVAQSESPYVFPNVLKNVYQLFAELFKSVLPYRIVVPTFPSGQLYFMLGATKEVRDISFSNSRIDRFFRECGNQMKFLSRDLLAGVFAVPPEVLRMLRNAG